jgi:hypothetical protein
MEHDVVVDVAVVVVVVVVVAAAAAAAAVVVGCLEAVKPMASRRHTVVGAMYIYTVYLAVVVVRIFCSRRTLGDPNKKGSISPNNLAFLPCKDTVNNMLIRSYLNETFCLAFLVPRPALKEQLDR